MLQDLRFGVTQVGLLTMNVTYSSSKTVVDKIQILAWIKINLLAPERGHFSLYLVVSTKNKYCYQALPILVPRRCSLKV